jgi:hypothetical protein
VKKNLKKFLFIAIAIIAIGAVAYYVYDSIPPTITKVTAQFGGEDNNLIVVEYYTDKPLKTDILADRAYVIVEGTNEVLPVQGVPIIGPMITKSVGKKTGWFVIDNGELHVTNDTPITIVIGTHKEEHYIVLPQ